MDPGSAAHHAARHSASKTRVNALMALRSVRGTHPRQSKPRRTLFRERLDAFLDLGAAHAVAMPLVGGVFVARAAIEAAVDPADRGNAEILEPVDHDLERRSGALLFDGAGGALGDRVEIVAGAEGAAGAGEHHYPDGRISFDPVEKL